MKVPSLQKHITATYINLRVGLALLAIALPFVLAVVGYLVFGLPLQGSMSAYYHAGEGAVRDVFVGVLIAVGAFLYLYKGFTAWENIALNFAGIFLVGVALVPMQWDCEPDCSKFSLHGTFAVLFFLTIAYVCIFRASDTLGLISDPAKASRYKRVYRWLGIGMIASPAIALVLTWVLQPGADDNFWVFFVEAVGVFVFGAYWIVKSYEIAETNAERRAVEGKLNTRQYLVADVFKEISVAEIKAEEP